MMRALRIASEVTVYAVMIGLPFLPSRLPRVIGLSLGVAAFVAMCTHMAFRLHDTNVARNDLSSRD